MSGPREPVDALGDGPQRVDVEARVGLVEHRDLRPQQRQLQQLHPLLLAAREAVVEVTAGEVLRDVGQRHRLLGGPGEVFDLDLRSSPRASRWALMIIRRYLETETPGIATGYWKAMKRPACERSLGVGLGDVLALEGDRALGHLVGGMAHDRVGERRLAGAVRPHQGVDACPSRRRGRDLGGSPSPRCLTCRFRISSSANFAPFLGSSGVRRRYAA